VRIFGKLKVTTLPTFSWEMMQIFNSLAMPILRTVITGQQRICDIHQETLVSEKITVWCGVASFGLTGTHFLENKTGGAVTVNSACYLEMLHAYLKPNLHRFGVEILTVWFRQDEATAHTVRNAMWVIGMMFPDHVITERGNTEWPAKSISMPATCSSGAISRAGCM